MIGAPQVTLVDGDFSALYEQVFTGVSTTYATVTNQVRKNIYLYPTDSSGKTFTIREATNLDDPFSYSTYGTLACTTKNSPADGFCKGTLTLNGVGGSGNVVCQLSSPGTQKMLACAAQSPQYTNATMSIIALTPPRSLIAAVPGTAVTTTPTPNPGTPPDLTITIKNLSGRKVSTMGQASVAGERPQAPFAYKGGNYPGTGGTCGSTLAAYSTCTVVLSYNPSSYSTTAQTFRQEYDNAVLTTQGVANITGATGLSSIAVTPSTASYTVGGNQQFTAVATYSNASTQDVTSLVAWSSNATSAATINSSGLASWVGGGTATLTATLGSVSGNKSVSVIPNPINLTGTANSSTQITLAYASGGTGTAKYQIAYQSGASAPANCSSGTQIGYATVGSSTSYAISSLSIYTQYSFRVCAVDSSNNISSGVTVTTTTLTAPGTLDLTFNSTGKVTTAVGSLDNAWGGLVQSDGKIVAVGDAKVGSNINFAVVRYNSNGTLDTSFNSTGKVTTAIGSKDDSANSVVQLSDGKLLVGGYTTTGTKTQAVAIVKYNTNGSLDTTFNSTGIVTFTLNGLGHDAAQVLRLQSDGKIVVGGWTARSNTSAAFQFFAARLNTNGTLDTTFNSTGKVILSIGSGDDTGQGMILDSNEKIVLVGYTTGTDKDSAVIRLNTNGSLDTTFNSTGKVTTPTVGSGNDSYWGVAIQSDGKIVTSGYAKNGSSDWNSIVARYNTNGTLDTSFGTNGIVNLNHGATDEQANAVMIDSNGKIITTGYVTNSSNDDMHIMRLTSTGALDTTFNSTGYTNVDFSSGQDTAWWVTQQSSDGKIISLGHSGALVALARLWP